ncbi:MULTISPECIES: NAD(P)/FAD-dependent oxidoreductase [Marivita]|uniref:NAD(P)/FAD-dependent oxidoreductase n=1 Tax=Marivita cryptomonadis TaxID=505252 RepID=A0A9Q2NU10_9RHOB|nr:MULTISPECIES: FAD/NAD(P)-binding oxidoreductase [Marivita]MBM2319732.1 NAD(P)/FAD-dependent oxidoreductase [Marivita cryptomonadis]MBM2329311.1 NAD(P)/FAD-dependent oxidoreductase [Marivita cryptomonadis]MBM2338899.1 NAD(P)/FAD-dependent oxidoreductase [Marivita cryptomonadis]MBM2343557.1 NAD(P)/FAD-dependent oxidoreductase [Marivita cryptomonadis]MBM2348234.1 NAD(P)/FAD-dependent oxidoreductase [Marivita cryptomonadis]
MDIKLNRRQMLSLAAGGAALAATGGAQRAAAQVATKARIVIIGAGAGGTSLANRLVERLDGAQITVIDPRAEHLYQPGLSLVAAGLKPENYVVSKTTDWLPKSVTLIAEAASAIDPEAKTVDTAGGQSIAYDFLVVAPGLILDHDAIDGFSLDMVGKNGIGALYAGPQYAAATWQAAQAYTETGGVGLFTRPATEMKCAGAPLKHTFLIEDIARTANTRGKLDVHYMSNNDSLFGVPIVSEKVRMLFGDRGITPAYSHVLSGIDAGAKTATFVTPDGAVTREYDYIHVIPPQRAPEVIRQSGLSWADKWTDQGWVECDNATLHHLRYDTIWALGDVAGVPKGKTAASVKWQVPVVEDGLIAAIEGRASTETYNGYTSCPMITRVGRAMLVEFDYNNNLVPSFPGIIAPLEELWISWLMKEVALKATYNAMLRGRA